MDPINPSVIALHGALVELTLRLGRVEDRLRMPDAPLATFARVIPPPQLAPHIDYTCDRGPEPCGCEETEALRARVEELSRQLRAMGGG